MRNAIDGIFVCVANHNLLISVAPDSRARKLHSEHFVTLPGGIYCSESSAIAVTGDVDFSSNNAGNGGRCDKRSLAHT